MSLSNEVGAGVDGLSQLRALMASGRKPGIMVALDFDFVEVDTGRAVFAGIPDEHAYNPIGTVHGGYTAALLDSACGCAVHSRLTAAQAYTTPRAESRLSQADHQRDREGACGGAGAIVRAKGCVRRGQTDRRAGQAVCVGYLDIAGDRPLTGNYSLIPLPPVAARLSTSDTEP